MIYAVVSYPACLVGGKYEFICWESPANVQTSYEATEHYFKSVEILQSSGL
jgi:hypothetical protein